MEINVFLVGGAVRDNLLGLPVKDRDWVVVGADAEFMLQQGFEQVGSDFPVFLHPETGEEYALARTERKTGQGYTAFDVHADKDVTLEQDLMRRDLTINAMAQDQHGNIIDPFGGQNDLQNKILRHTSIAFAEDPVRILRTARFAARYGFAVAPETMQLMCNMVNAGEVDALVKERVWKEFEKGLMENNPSPMIDVLHQCGALKKLLPELNDLFIMNGNLGQDTLSLLSNINQQDLALSLPERYATMLYHIARTPDTGLIDVKTINKRLNVPKQCAELAEVTANFWHCIYEYNELGHQDDMAEVDMVFHVLKKTDAIRRPERFQSALKIVFNGVPDDTRESEMEYWLNVLDVVQNIDTQAIVQQCGNNPKIIGQQMDIARRRAIEMALSKNTNIQYSMKPN